MNNSKSKALKSKIGDKEKSIVERAKILSKMRVMERDNKADYNKDYHRMHTDKTMLEQAISHYK